MFVCVFIIKYGFTNIRKRKSFDQNMQSAIVQSFMQVSSRAGFIAGKRVCRSALVFWIAYSPFVPDPVYLHCLRKTATKSNQKWIISTKFCFKLFPIFSFWFIIALVCSTAQTKLTQPNALQLSPTFRWLVIISNGLPWWRRTLSLRPFEKSECRRTFTVYSNERCRQFFSWKGKPLAWCGCWMYKETVRAYVPLPTHLFAAFACI